MKARYGACLDQTKDSHRRSEHLCESLVWSDAFVGCLLVVSKLVLNWNLWCFKMNIHVGQSVCYTGSFIASCTRYSHLTGHFQTAAGSKKMLEIIDGARNFQEKKVYFCPHHFANCPSLQGTSTVMAKFKYCIYITGTWRINSLRPSDAYMRQWTRTSLVQIMACRLVHAKPLSESLLEYF